MRNSLLKSMIAGYDRTGGKWPGEVVNPEITLTDKYNCKHITLMKPA